MLTSAAAIISTATLNLVRPGCRAARCTAQWKYRQGQLYQPAPCQELPDLVRVAAPAGQPAGPGDVVELNLLVMADHSSPWYLPWRPT